MFSQVISINQPILVKFSGHVYLTNITYNFQFMISVLTINITYLTEWDFIIQQLLYICGKYVKWGLILTKKHLVYNPMILPENNGA